MGMLQNLYNLSQPYPRKHSPSVSKERRRALRSSDEVIYEKGGKVSAFLRG